MSPSFNLLDMTLNIHTVCVFATVHLETILTCHTYTNFHYDLPA